MPKSSRNPQRRRKAQQRARTASQGIQQVKPPFPYSLITNAKFFYIVGGAALVVGLFAFLVVDNTNDPDEDDIERNPTATPTQGSVTPTATPDLTTTPATSTTPGGSVTPSVTVEGTVAPAEQTFSYSAPPPLTIDTANQYFATIRTEKGDIRIELFDDVAPNTVNNFVFLAREGFYDGVTFHRVLPGFVAQAGDRGPGTPGYTVNDEINDNRHVRGAVAMAKLPGADDFGSQFYIAYPDLPSLDGTYTVFGQVVEGMEVVDALAPRDPDPNDPDALPPGDAIITIEIEEVEG